jgi:biopolymer transport protein ExbB
MKTGIISALLLAGAVFAQENYTTAWTGHKNVIINTQAIGVTTTQVNFPVLIRLAAADSAIFAAAKAGGADLRFTKANNTTRLPHQIESWNATTKTATVWVLADTILGTKNNNVIRMHWGNASAADSSSGAQVFKTAAGFQAVWHMNGTSNDSDATSNGIHLAVDTLQQAPASGVGAINGARVFAGSQYLRAVGSATGPLNFPAGGNYSISAWVNAAELATHGVIVSKHDMQYALKFDQNNNLEFFEFNGGWNAVNSAADQGVWLYVTGVQNGTDAALYINGARVDGGVVNTANGGARVENIDALIGAEPTNTTVRRFFIGSIDELRMHNVSRTADWVKLEYNIQKSGQTTVKLLDTVPAALSRGVFTARNGGLTVKPMGNGLQFRVEGAGAAKARVAVMDMWGRTVWSRLSDLSANTVSWDGRAANGQLAPQGVYAVRITLLNAQGRTTQVLEQKVPFTR